MHVNFVTLILVASLIVSTTSSNFNLLCKRVSGTEVLNCACTEDIQNFQIDFEEQGLLEDVKYFKLEHCETANLHSNIFNESDELKEIHISDIGNLTFDAELPSLVEVFDIKNVGRVKTIKMSSFKNIANMTYISFENTIIEDIEPNTFKDVWISEEIRFTNVTFLNLPGDFLALMFLGKDEKPIIIFESCIFSKMADDLLSISMSPLVNIEFSNNTLDCSNMQSNFSLLQQLLEVDINDTVNVQCMFLLSENYCSEERDETNQLIYHLIQDAKMSIDIRQHLRKLCSSLIGNITESYYDEMCERVSGESEMLNCTCTEEITDFKIEISHSLLDDVEYFTLENCMTANLHRNTFKNADELREIHINDVDNLSFDVELPSSIEVIDIKNVGRLTTIELFSFNNFDNMTSISFENTTIEDIEPGTFKYIRISEEISFTNVTFLNLPGDSLALLFSNKKPEPDLIFNSCTFSKLDDDPPSISMSPLVDIEFKNNTLDCSNMEANYALLQQLFEEDIKDNFNVTCMFLTENYCSEERDDNDQLIYHLIRDTNMSDAIDLKLQEECLSLIDNTTESEFDELCEIVKGETEMLNCTCTDEIEDFKIDIPNSFLEHVEYFNLENCETADLHSDIFKNASQLKEIHISDVDILTFDAELPSTIDIIEIRDVGRVKTIKMSIFHNIDIMTNISFEDTIIEYIEANTFKSLLISDEMRFTNVTFLNLPGDSLAFMFLDQEPKPDLIFDSCQFSELDDEPLSISMSPLVDIEFKNNTFDCSNIHINYLLLQQLFLKDINDNDTVQCMFLSENYCSEERDENDQLGYHLIRNAITSQDVRLEIQEECPSFTDNAMDSNYYGLCEVNRLTKRLDCECTETLQHFKMDFEEISTSFLEGIVDFNLENCTTANIHSNSFKSADQLREIHINDVDSLIFDAVLPASIDVFDIKDVGHFDTITMDSFKNAGSMTDISFENTLIEDIEPNSFKSVRISEEISFINVTFLNVTGDSLALMFVDVDPEPDFIFNSCTFSTLDDDPPSISMSPLVNIEFKNNTLDCSNMQINFLLLQQLFDEDIEDNANVTCMFLSENYCSEERDENDQLSYHIMQDVTLSEDIGLRRDCPDFYSDVTPELFVHYDLLIIMFFFVFIYLIVFLLSTKDFRRV